MLLKQDATIREKIKSGATLDEAVDPSNKEFGPLAHPEQVQMRVAKRAMMLEAGIAPYPVHLDVTDTIEAVRAKYDGKLWRRDRRHGRHCWPRAVPAQRGRPVLRAAVRR